MEVNVLEVSEAQDPSSLSWGRLWRLHSVTQTVLRHWIRLDPIVQTLHLYSQSPFSLLKIEPTSHSLFPAVQLPHSSQLQLVSPRLLLKVNVLLWLKATWCYGLDKPLLHPR